MLLIANELANEVMNHRLRQIFDWTSKIFANGQTVWGTIEIKAIA